MDLRPIFADQRFEAVNEARLQEQIADLLTERGIGFAREVRLSAEDRIDFLVGAVGIEVKTKGSRHAVLRQLARYAAHERIQSLWLATTRWQLGDMPRSLGAKPLGVLPLYRGAL